MKRIWKILLTSLACVVVVGTVASASPSLRTTLGDLETPAEAVGPSGPSGPSDPSGPSGPSGPAGPSGPSGPSGPIGPEELIVPTSPDGDPGGTPDFSACEGLQGLDNAICLHEALLLVQPENQGLLNALERLMANKERHDDEVVEPDEESPDTPGKSGDAPGKSGDAPGKSGDAPGKSGDAPGKSGDAPGKSG